MEKARVLIRKMNGINPSSPLDPLRPQCGKQPSSPEAMAGKRAGEGKKQFPGSGSRREFLKSASLAGVVLTGAGTAPAQISSQGSQQKHNEVTVDYAVARLEDGREISNPFWRVDSGQEGPSLALIASQHGNEVQGAEVARRFQEVCAKQLIAGSVWLVPMANLLAVRSRRHSFDLKPEQNNNVNPDKFHNMQKHWPGDSNGNDTARLAYSLDQSVLRHCSHAVDMHCYAHIFAAAAFSDGEHDLSRAMGEVTTTRFIRYRNTVIPKNGKMMVSQMMRSRGAGIVVMELSGQFQMQERQIQIGLNSMINIAKLLGMMKGKPESIEGKRAMLIPTKTHEVQAACTGIFTPAAKEGESISIGPDDYVGQGQPIGHIIRENDLETIPLISPVSGYIRRLGVCHWNLCDASLPAQHPYTEEGEKVAEIVTV